VKWFSIVIQYFTIEEGLKNFVLDFYEDCDESSKAIFNNIDKVLKKITWIYMI
jgi:hypothetical protein